MVETQSDEILQNADKEDISLLVVGDPFGWVIRIIHPFINPERQVSDNNRSLVTYLLRNTMSDPYPINISSHVNPTPLHRHNTSHVQWYHHHHYYHHHIDNHTLFSSSLPNSINIFYLWIKPADPTCNVAPLHTPILSFVHAHSKSPYGLSITLPSWTQLVHVASSYTILDKQFPSYSSQKPGSQIVFTTGSKKTRI